MYDDFFFPYEKAKLWTGNMFLLSLSNFLLYASLYMMLPVLPLWMVRLCGSRSSHCCFRAGHVPSGNIQQLPY
jgi:hypothetical protein